jgi:hypothetical protein
MVRTPKIAVTYTNRKGTAYFLCRGVTKTGKTRYFFAREIVGEPVEKVPEGYEIRESVNGVVSLVKAQPALLLETEIGAVNNAVANHPRAKLYRVDAKARQITVYEYVGTDPQEVARDFSERFGAPWLSAERFAEFEARSLARGQFAPVMRFTLIEDRKRRFQAERMCYRGGSDHWIVIAFNKSIDELARTLIPILGSDKFFELF